MSKVLIYALNYAPEQTGVGRYTSDVGSFLSEQGHTVRVVTAVPHYPEWRIPANYNKWSYKKEMFNTVSVTRCPIYLKRPMRGIWRLLAPLSFALTSLPPLVWSTLLFRPNVILCIEPTLLVAPAAILFGWLVGARTVLHVQDFEVDAAFAVGHLRGSWAQHFASHVETKLLQRFSQIITISARMRDTIIKRGASKDRVFLTRNWVDIGVIRPTLGTNFYRSMLAVGDNVVVALYAGSIGAKQSLRIVLEAARTLENRRDIVFVIVGEGPEKDNLVRDYGQLPNIRFLTSQPEKLMCTLLNFADIHILSQGRGIADMVLPSKLGGMLASGKPVLATADEGTELFEVLNGIAIVVPSENSDAIAQELRYFCDNGLTHPSIGNAQPLLLEMSADTALLRIAEILCNKDI